MKRKIPDAFLNHLRRRHQVELAGRGVTWRAVLAGLAMVLVVSLGAPYSIWIVGSSEITWSYFPIGVGVPFILLVLANAAVKRCRRAWGLGSAELITAALMGLAASGIPIFIVGYIMGIISKPYYGAMPQNKWATFVHPYLPDWLIPSPENDAMRFFYEGLPLGQERIPWETWLGPLAWWLSLILAINWVCFCLVVVLRKQWVEHERLAFPLVEVPLLLTEESPDSTLPPTLRSRAFWIGCTVPLAIILFNIIGYFTPGSPQIPIHQERSVILFQSIPPVKLIVYFPVVGFTYLVPTAISFSTWFFVLVHLVEISVVNLTGMNPMRPDAYVIGWNTLSWQSYGAFVAMVLWSLWMARHHLRDVVRSVLEGDEGNDGAEEMISYRLAVCGGLAGIGYILAWLWRVGMDLPVAALFLMGALIIFLGITRLVIQTGMHYLTTPMTAQGLTLAITGTGVGPHSLMALALCYSWCGDVQSTFMPSAAHAVRLHGFYRERRSLGLAGVLGLAVVVSFVATALFMLYLCYDYGAGNLRSWFFNTAAGAGGRAFDALAQQLRNPWSTDWTKLGFFGLGALVYSLLSVCHYRFSWWPLHPIGLTVSSIWMLQRIAVSVFIAWAAKRLILRFGGAGLYRRLRPFFIGLVVGFFAGVGISYAVDVLWFFGKGHPILHG